MLSTYQFASNTPIRAVDLDEKEAWVAYIEHYNNCKTPKIHLEFDVDLKDIQAIYEVHRYYDKNNYVEYITTGSTSFSDPKYTDKFPNNGQLSREDGKPLITLEVYGQIIYGEISFKPNKYVDASFGMNGVAYGKSYSTGGNEKSKTEVIDGSNPEWNLGGSVNVAGAGFEARQKYYPAQGIWGETNINGELVHDSTMGIKADGLTGTNDASFKVGVPEFKISLGLGVNGGAYLSINSQPILSYYEKKLKDAFKRPNYHVKEDTPDINAHKQN